MRLGKEKSIGSLQYLSQLKLNIFSEEWEKLDSFNFLEHDINTPFGAGTPRTRPSLALFYAIRTDDLELVIDLCFHGADVNLPDPKLNTITPVQYASQLGRSHIVEYLMKQGAKTDTLDITALAAHASQPLTFLWSMKETLIGNEVDYGRTEQLISPRRTEPNI